jgi:predicted HAD superfamily Cof-like phosphohydrolase
MSIQQVKEFHGQFGLPTGRDDYLTGNMPVAEFRLAFMQEELDEFEEASLCSDRVKMFDALLDLAYVVYGTALFMGITPEQWEAGMSAVHKVNMLKERATDDSSKRGTSLDVVKPEGWVGPEQELATILGEQ